MAWLISVCLLCLQISLGLQQQCPEGEDESFAVVTGYVFSSPGGDSVLATKSGILSLAECLSECKSDATCQSVNYETGLCVLFAKKPDSQEALTKSQFPVFSTFAEKICVRKTTCSRAWSVEVIQGEELKAPVSSRHTAKSIEECYNICLTHTEHVCRSATFVQETSECALSEMDRFTVSSLSGPVMETKAGTYYIESNCVNEPVKMCDFTEMKGRILKTVDAVVQEVETQQQCRQLCLADKDFRCHSFDYSDTGPKVCRLSHHASQSLQDIEEPYLQTEGAVTHQMTSCYNITIDCRSDDMVAKVQTNKLFDGKVYAKSRPNSCVTDVHNSMEFEITLGYHELGCDVKQTGPGKFSSDIIIQHHDQIVTGQDLGLSVRCSYNLQNRSVGHGVELAVSGEPEPAGSEEASFVISPTVTMRITDRKGQDVRTAQVGDALSLRFQILDHDSPYQIFVRELIALDGVDSSEILLVDSLGCPTDPTIMGPISTVSETGQAQILEAPFDAFKFPTSDVVQFKALVTPCLPICEPVACQVEDYYGMVRKVDSFGRKKRQVSTRGKEEVVIQTIRIEDKFKFNDLSSTDDVRAIKEEMFIETEKKLCVDSTDILITASSFIAIQLFLAVACIFMWHRLRFSSADTTTNSCSSTMINPQPWFRFYRLT